MIKTQIELTAELNDYIIKNSVPESPFLNELRKQHHSSEDIIFQITPLQAQFLSFLAKLINAKKTLDIGTYKGYSALTVALSTTEDSKTISCDKSEEFGKVAKEFWAKAGVSNKIDFILGEATQVLENLIKNGEQDTFDFIFIDADKVNYVKYYELSLKLIRPGGLIVVDNTLYFGTVAGVEVTDPEIITLISNEGTEEIKRLNAIVANDDQIEMCLLPVADGLTLIKKKINKTAMDNLAFYTAEYGKLKDEQLKRIEFRDHMIYLTLIALGTVFAFCLEKPQYNIAFLVLPFFCIIMGWTYYANDRKVSSIGDYINNSLIPKIASITNQPIEETWESMRKNDPDRKFRKWFQLLIDVSLFCISSAASIFAFYLYHDCICWTHNLVAGVASLLIITLSIFFIKNSHK
ncbi:MAG: class I SAM-dependent methyltransferase [Sphingobacteriales bacterium]|nr:class I SAM-dependent methyltransferase [Sphingobacteriales bacterium]